jgi:tetratricopeptide (TPR) repeat protein
MARRLGTVARIGALVGVVLLALALSGAGLTPVDASFELLWFLIGFIVVIPIHELGHALAGALVGYQVRAVMVGVGPSLLAFTVAGVSVQIKVLPLGGVTLGLPRRESWLRLRQWIFSAGGLTANLLLYFALERAYGRGGGLHDGTHPFAAVTAAVNWAVLLLNLIPFRSNEGWASDGYSLLTIPFWGRGRIEEARAAVESVPLLEALARDDLDTAARVLEGLRTRYPEQPRVALFAGNVLHRQGDHQAARVAWREGLARETFAPRIALFKNNVAFVDVVIGDEEGLREADALSAEALASNPEMAAFQGTRGALLARLGRPAEALPLLRSAIRATKTKDGQAYDRASLVSALARLGRLEEAQRELDEVRSLNPTCALLPAAEADLAAATEAATAGRPPPASGERPSVLTDALLRWGGLARWRQVARALAVVSTIFDHNLSMPGAAVIAAVAAVLLSPQPACLIVFAVFNLGRAALFGLGLEEELVGEAASPWMVALTSLLGIAALALAAVRGRLGPSVPSKAPTLLRWFLVAFAALMALPFAISRRHAPSPEETVTLLAAMAALLTSPRIPVKALAVIPALLAVSAIASAGRSIAAREQIDRIPSGPALTWSARRPATVLRSRRLPIKAGQVTLSPGGRAFAATHFERSSGELRAVVSIGDFEGRLFDVYGLAAAFLDDERVLVVQHNLDTSESVTLVEVRLAAGPDPTWRRTIPLIDVYYARIEVQPDGGAIVAAESVREGGIRRLARVPAQRDGPVEIFEFVSRQPDADAPLGRFEVPGGAVGELVARVPSADGTGRYVWPKDREGDEPDSELWLLSTAPERLIAAHAPALRCASGSFGRPILWCLGGDSGRRALLAVDPTTGRMTRLSDLPGAGTVETIGASRLAVAKGNQLAVIDLEAHTGTWLTLPPPPSDRWLRLVSGGLAIITGAAGDEQSTLTVYAMP